MLTQRRDALRNGIDPTAIAYKLMTVPKPRRMTSRKGAAVDAAASAAAAASSPTLSAPGPRPSQSSVPPLPVQELDSAADEFQLLEEYSDYSDDEEDNDDDDEEDDDEVDDEEVDEVDDAVAGAALGQDDGTGGMWQ